MSQLWRTAQTGLRSRLSPHVFDNWIRPIEGRELDNGSLRLIVPTQFHAQWLEENYSDLLKTELQTEFQFEVRESPSPVLRIIPGGGERPAAPSHRIEESFESGLAPSLTPSKINIEPQQKVPPRFNVTARIQAPSPSFIPTPPASPAPSAPPQLPPSAPLLSPPEFGKATPYFKWMGVQRISQCTQLFLQKAGQLPFNPMVISGGAGMGKTAALRYEIGIYKKSNPDFRVGYISIPQFAKEMVDAITKKKMQDFQHRYQHNYDCLVIDDIQYLEGKGKTQQEFLHLLNFFIIHNKPVIVLSQQPVSHLKVEESLAVRFLCGLQLEIPSLDQVTQNELFRGLLNLENLRAPDELVDHLNHCLVRSVASLIAILNQLKVHHLFTGTWPTMKDWANWIQPHAVHRGIQALDSSVVVQHICQSFGIKLESLKGPGRKKSLTDARRVLVLILRERCQLNLTEIGEILGRHHSTVLNLLETGQAMLQEDRIFARQVNFIQDQVSSPSSSSAVN